MPNSPHDSPVFSKSVLVNRLAEEKSPYLLQHAGNPVHWQPWDEAAFVLARKRNRPVFLSIGYATCHWCHVMERESFEDPEVAEMLNAWYIPIKVDREERPDIDQTYMTACQMMTGQGGWPLTLVLTPEKEAFFAATYLPRESRPGQPGMLYLLRRIAEAWRGDESGIRHSAGELRKALADIRDPSREAQPLDEQPLRRALEEYRRDYDAEWGGFDGAPKFPAPHNLSLLLRLARRFDYPEGTAMVLHTLRAIRQGGVYDQIGHGLHRYAVDRKWHIPHFEKMLYDQATFILAAVEAYQAGGADDLLASARETAVYLLDNLRDDLGAFHCGEDADSEGAEGTYYLWRKERIEAVLGQEDAALVLAALALEGETSLRGGMVLRQALPLERLAASLKLDPEPLAARLDHARRKLLAERRKRARPFRDDKILVGWNGLAIAALARLGAITGDAELILGARRAADFIGKHLHRADGRLLRRWRDNQAAIPGFLEDYAFFAWGHLELFLADFREEDLDAALTLTEQMLDLFDDGQGGLYDEGRDTEGILDRSRNLVDGALPSGSAVAAGNLLRLGRLLDRGDLEARGELLLRMGMAEFAKHPRTYAQQLCSLDLALSPPLEIVLAAPNEDGEVRKMLDAARSRFLPEGFILPHTPDTCELQKRIPFLEGKSPKNGEVRAYLCRDRSCRDSVHGLRDFIALLNEI
jgi:hypothetical protein